MNSTYVTGLWCRTGWCRGCSEGVRRVRHTMQTVGEGVVEGPPRPGSPWHRAVNLMVWVQFSTLDGGIAPWVAMPKRRKP
jgi:hypothetical protein